MEDAKKLIDEALMILSALSVSGDAVVMMAEAKSKLRNASGLLTQKEV